MDKVSASIIDEVANGDVYVRDDYSGRGMYGDITYAVECENINTFATLLIQAVIMAVDSGDEELVSKFEQWDPRFDNMGLGIVVY